MPCFLPKEKNQRKIKKINGEMKKNRTEFLKKSGVLFRGFPHIIRNRVSPLGTEGGILALLSVGQFISTFTGKRLAGGL